jgi:hypothetical protein
MFKRWLYSLWEGRCYYKTWHETAYYTHVRTTVLDLGYVLMIWNCYHYITYVFLVCSVSILYYFYQKRKRIVLLFLSNVDKTILGKFNGVQYQAHAFASNVVEDTRPWDEDHLSGTKTKWDLFYDPGSYGYCYGIAFCSLQLIQIMKCDCTKLPLTIIETLTWSDV